MTSTYVAFSGGIDSTTTALLFPDAIPVFTDTGWEFDELYAHIEKFERVTGRHVEHIQRDESLPEYIRRSKFLPNHGARFCTRMFKIEPMNAWIADKLPATLYIGLRADEPAEMRVGNLSLIDGLTIEYPLRQMGYDRTACIRKCIEFNLLPRYPVYMARGGCKGCFYKRRAEVKAMAQLVPGVLDELRHLEENVQDERGKYFVMFPNANMSISDIQAQETLFDLTELYQAAAEDGDYGVACGLFCHR